MSKKTLKEIFYQDAEYELNIPACCVVQYYIGDVLTVEYFDTDYECWDFVENDFKLNKAKK